MYQWTQNIMHVFSKSFFFIKASSSETESIFYNFPVNFSKVSQSKHHVCYCCSSWFPNTVTTTIELRWITIRIAIFCFKLRKNIITSLYCTYEYLHIPLVSKIIVCVYLRYVPVQYLNLLFNIYSHFFVLTDLNFQSTNQPSNEQKANKEAKTTKKLVVFFKKGVETSEERENIWFSVNYTNKHSDWLGGLCVWETSVCGSVPKIH